MSTLSALDAAGNLYATRRYDSGNNVGGRYCPISQVLTQQSSEEVNAMAVKKYLSLIVVVLGALVNVPLAFTQSASANLSQARSVASYDCASLRHGNPKAQWTRLLKDSLTISNAREGNLLLAESVSPDSIDPHGMFMGRCRAQFVESNPKTAKGGEWVLDGHCFAYVQGCGPIFQDQVQCPPGAKALNPIFKSCGSYHAEIDLDRPCQN